MNVIFGMRKNPPELHRDCFGASRLAMTTAEWLPPSLRAQRSNPGKFSLACRPRRKVLGQHRGGERRRLAGRDVITPDDAQYIETGGLRRPGQPIDGFR